MNAETQSFKTTSYVRPKSTALALYRCMRTDNEAIEVGSFYLAHIHHYAVIPSLTIPPFHFRVVHRLQPPMRSGDQ